VIYWKFKYSRTQRALAVGVSGNGTQKNRYKVLIDIPELKAKTTYSKKPSNKIASSDNYVAEAKRVMLKNPFLQ